MFSFKELTPDEVVKAHIALKNISVSRTIICTLGASPQAKQIAKSQSIILLEKEDTFVKFLKEYNYFPPENELITLQKEDGLTFKTIMKNALSPKRARLYFISAVALGFSSLFVPYNIYYLSFASSMLLLCLITLIQPYFKKKLPDNII
ncbi:MAG: hypothetical protein ACOX6H_00845 [Christensenellales bacterium]|jgi:hypothetical protein